MRGGERRIMNMEQKGVKKTVEVAILCGIRLMTLRCGFLRIRRKMNSTAWQDGVRNEICLMSIGFFLFYRSYE